MIKQVKRIKTALNNVKIVSSARCVLFQMATIHKVLSSFNNQANSYVRPCMVNPRDSPFPDARVRSGLIVINLIETQFSLAVLERKILPY